MKQSIQKAYTSLEKLFKKGLFVFLKRLLNNPPLTGKLPAENVNKVLILRYDVIGDMIVTLPAIQYLKLINPTIQIDVLASTKNAGIIEYDTNIHTTYIHDIPLLKKLQLFRKLKKNGYDIIFPCVTNKATYIGIISNLMKSSHTVISTPARYNKYSFLFHYQSVLAKSQESIWNMFLYLIYDTIETTVLPEVAQPYVSIPQSITNSVLQTIQQLGTQSKDSVLINLSTRHERNEWTETGYINVIQHILAHTELHVVITCMEQDAELANRLSCISNNVHVYPKTRQILEVVALVKEAKLILTPDTGIVHMASAMKTPLVAMYVGDTPAPVEWGPFRLEHYALVTSTNGQFVRTIEPDKVIAAIDSVLTAI